MISTKDNAVYTEVVNEQDVGQGNWVESVSTTLNAIPHEIALESGSSNNTLKTFDVMAEQGLEVIFTKADNTIVEHTLGPVTLEPGTTFISIAETGTSGEIVIPSDGIINIAIAGGGGGGGDYYGGGGSGLVIQNNITVTKGQSIGFTIGAGGTCGTELNAKGTNGGTTSILAYTALGGGGGGRITNTPGVGSNGGGNGGYGGSSGLSLFYGGNGVGFQFPSLAISIAGIGGAPGTIGNQGGYGGQYGGGGGGAYVDGNYENGKNGTFGGGGGGGQNNGSSTRGGAGGAGYIYIAYKPNISSFDISSLGLTVAPSKVFVDDEVEAHMRIGATSGSLPAYTKLTRTGRTFDGTKFTYTYGNYSATGKAMQRTITATKEGTTVTEPLTSEMIREG